MEVFTRHRLAHPADLCSLAVLLGICVIRQRKDRLRDVLSYRVFDLIHTLAIGPLSLHLLPTHAHATAAFVPGESKIRMSAALAGSGLLHDGMFWATLLSACRESGANETADSR